MSSGKPKRLLTVNFFDTQHDRPIVVKYLQSLPTDAKSQIILSTTGYFYALAFSEQPDISKVELRLALAKSVRHLSNQITNIVDHYKIVHEIELPSNSLESNLPKLPKMLSSIPLEQNSQNSTMVVESVLSGEINKGQNDDDDDDDDDDDMDWDTPVVRNQELNNMGLDQV